MSTLLTEDHKDALQEFMNISMGQAASKLASLLDLHVTISVPNVHIATDEDLERIQSREDAYFYTRQSFFGEMDGELITIISRQGCKTVVNDLNRAKGYETGAIELEESILDISNILSGASLKGLCQQIDVKTRIQPPVLFEPSKQALPVSDWKLSLVMEIMFLIEKDSFSANTIICFADKELDKVFKRLDKLM
ncbi:CheY-P phosphatase CheC [Vibrio aerogenes CECT 7868]|uniref:CheY-P phosphatase CheC n=1 Tax=Vibrio aerogenes CECT 7868 TaxID=1216006 RepID=A0A1M6CAX4_9VIBR|nr:chemotaxis protein CheC [Vibrio aerogenes]SHI58159.1 CheY-P phosphatase CheC [Vibrio aerogenes CECT 7868]